MAIQKVRHAAGRVTPEGPVQSERRRTRRSADERRIRAQSPRMRVHGRDRRRSDDERKQHDRERTDSPAFPPQCPDLLAHERKATGSKQT
jgi:hypothetical protein